MKHDKSKCFVLSIIWYADEHILKNSAFVMHGLLLENEAWGGTCTSVNTPLILSSVAKEGLVYFRKTLPNNILNVLHGHFSRSWDCLQFRSVIIWNHLEFYETNMTKYSPKLESKWENVTLSKLPVSQFLPSKHNNAPFQHLICCFYTILYRSPQTKCFFFLLAFIFNRQN